VEEEYHHRWAYDLRRYLQDLNDFAEDYRKSTGFIPKEYLIVFKEEFRKILERAKIENPEWQAPLGKRKIFGNLLRRIILYRNAVIGFMYNLKTPFTNNQAE